ncbi:nose resistant to fluoxetine protein 6-like [Rhipicephalus sanguineus]|uniref:nose resistant to fluoxetine protein 6-like n=1 Tax=Rhipicephalus sanguineus TaxID=34632 RepID=UPI0020C53FCA|nr:nose resistant to fluoxetine protein 6-like [Rhipicephalus sanguineus]
MRTVNDYYMKPFYHAVCYFSGCMTCLIVADFRKRKISKTFQLAGWCVSVSCALFSVFVKLPWYLKENPTSNDIEIVVAFFDRILWSISIAWLTLACSTGLGGPVSKLLSWNAFVPLSKLTYGVYLIHLPLFELMMHSSRERVDFSEFNRATVFFGVLLWCYVLSYFAFITCEAPTKALDKLVFGRLIRGGSSLKHEHQELLEDSNLKKESRGGENNEMSLR